MHRRRLGACAAAARRQSRRRSASALPLNTTGAPMPAARDAPAPYTVGVGGVDQRRAAARCRMPCSLRVVLRHAAVRAATPRTPARPMCMRGEHQQRMVDARCRTGSPPARRPAGRRSSRPCASRPTCSRACAVAQAAPAAAARRARPGTAHRASRAPSARAIRRCSARTARSGSRRAQHEAPSPRSTRSTRGAGERAGFVVQGHLGVFP